MSPIRVGVIGASGYSGEELVRLLANHPGIDLRIITSRQYENMPLGSVFPNIGRYGNLPFSNPDQLEIISKETDAVFLALPHGKGLPYAHYLYEQGKVVIDLSADFRLQNPLDYELYYKFSHPYPELLKKAVYALAEIYVEQIGSSNLLAMPGCYPTGVLLSIIPLLKKGWIDPQLIEVFAISGTTGAGKTLDSKLLFSEISENLRPYGFPNHRHVPEILQEIKKMVVGKPVGVLFVPVLAPLCRGILLCITATLTTNISQQEAEDAVMEFYKKSPFIKVLSQGIMPELKFVLHTNYLYFSIHLLAEKKKCLVVAAIDNLGKGAAGQAIQAMNIRFGLAQTTGLGP